MANQQILLIVSGGIAAYRSLDIARRLRERGVAVRMLLTRAAEEFITPLSATVLSGQAAMTDLFSPENEADIGHIELSRSADLLLVAPASADLLAKMANGLADDLASTVLLATDTPVLVAPAMNVRMWEHSATRRNVNQLRADGIGFIGPDDGAMACGEFGPGRLAEVDAIVDAATSMLGAHVQKDGEPATKTSDTTDLLDGNKILVTAGPTHEPIDPVRYIANRSSGKQGYAIAAAAARAGAEVTLVSGPTALATPPGVRRVDVESARDMQAAVVEALSDGHPFDAGIFAAAVADWRTADIAEEKMKKRAGAEVPPPFDLIANPDILAEVARDTALRPHMLVGFAAETQDVVANAEQKLSRKQCDLIVANDVSSSGALAEGEVMGGDRNRVHLVSKSAVETWAEADKTVIAERLVEHIAHFLDMRSGKRNSRPASRQRATKQAAE